MNDMKRGRDIGARPLPGAQKRVCGTRSRYLPRCMPHHIRSVYQKVQLLAGTSASRKACQRGVTW